MRHPGNSRSGENAESTKPQLPHRRRKAPHEKADCNVNSVVKSEVTASEPTVAIDQLAPDTAELFPGKALKVLYTIFELDTFTADEMTWLHFPDHHARGRKLQKNGLPADLRRHLPPVDGEDELSRRCFCSSLQSRRSLLMRLQSAHGRARGNFTRTVSLPNRSLGGRYSRALESRSAWKWPGQAGHHHELLRAHRVCHPRQCAARGSP